MMIKAKRMVAALVATVVMFNSVNTSKLNVSAAGEGVVAHTVQAGASHEGNPLKGFVSYSGKVSFPVSMEWFYLPVNAVQTGMNSFNWTALENKLNEVASRGNQAVFRFYYDYPNESTGIPQFLLDGGLQTKYYSDYNDIGGYGYCPDYTDANFRQSMKNFIKAFGDNYDGDGRIAYITVGLLGFWGEWHNYPFDDKWSSEYDSFFVVPTEVQKEVLEGFKSAFSMTKLCVREPKSGIDYSQYNVGFHDDSFAYATLSTQYGGQDWSFMSKMRNYGVADIWKRECIGGEIYPPSQEAVFSGNAPSNGNFQDWNKCLEEAHPTWMLNYSITKYSGTALDNAKKAAVQMGYDFQVDKAYYKDIYTEGETVSLGIDLKNIGIAPFYYDHRTWPVEIALKQNGNTVTSKVTTWDLNKVEAGGSYYYEDSFNWSATSGEYDICIRVINPIANGAKLGFANKDMGSDGWLRVGHLNVEKQNVTKPEETTITVETTTAEETTKQEISNGEYVAWQDSSYVYVNVPVDRAYSQYEVMLDTDNNSSTGFITDGIGVDYMLESGMMWKHPENNSVWGFDKVDQFTFEKNDNSNGFTVKIGRDCFDNKADTMKIIVKLLDESWTAISNFTVIEAKMKMEETDQGNISIEGFQISTLNKGLKTVYSTSNYIDGKKVEEVGLIYSIDGADHNSEDMIVGSESEKVYSYIATANGLLPTTLSQDKSYAMTMKYRAGTAKEFSHIFYVRAFAKLQDGTYAYSDIESYTVYNIANYVYSNGMVNNAQGSDYIYENILKVVNPEYEKKDYSEMEWGLVK